MLEEQKEVEQVKPFLMNFSSGEDNSKTTTLSMPPDGVHMVARILYTILKKGGMEVEMYDNFSESKDPDVE